MRTLPFFVANAFTKHPFKGNPAGVVLEAHDLDTNTMQKIAADLQCSETAFVTDYKNAIFNIRFFSPVKEVDLCGHATVAAFYALVNSGVLRRNRVAMQTNAGIFTVEIRGDTVFMEQLKPVFRKANISVKNISNALRIKESCIGQLPVESVSTGLFSLNVPVRGLNTVQHMRPDFNAVAKLCKESHVGSLFAFTFETINPACFIHARCFAPLYGINEDPVTGTANGALGAYLKKYGLLETNIYKSEQGYEMGRDGLVIVDVTDDAVKIGGTACIALKGLITL